MIPRNVIKPNKDWNVTFLECEGDVINKSNIIIQHSLDVIPWFKDHRTATLRHNLKSSEPNASLMGCCVLLLCRSASEAGQLTC